MARLLSDSHDELAARLEAQQIQEEAQRLARQYRRENDIVSARAEGWSQRTVLREAGGHRPGMIQAQRQQARGRRDDGGPLRRD